MAFLYDKCIFSQLDKSVLDSCQNFDCGHDDLNDFFLNDSHNYSLQLLGKSYCFLLESDRRIIVCAFTVANDSIKANFLPNGSKKRVTKKIPHKKQFRSYPAVLIGRLGVSVLFKKQGIGCELMDFIKAWFVSPQNKTGCRFIVVDSYNEEQPISFYLKNGFKFLFSEEVKEKTYTGLQTREKLNTRLMTYDLIDLKVE